MPRLLALEWDAAEARVAVARTRGNDIIVEHAFSVDLELREGQTSGEEVGKRIAAAIAERNLGRIETLVAIGRTNIELRQLSLPPSPVEELPELVRFQALRQFTTITDEWPIDFVHVDAGDSESLHVIAAAISPELVKQIQSTCETADLSAKRLILRPFAAASLLHRRDRGSQPPCTLMVDLLADEADLTVMVDNRVAMLRTVRTPSRNDVDALSRALLGEIRRTMAAAQNQLTGHRVERIVLCGAGPVAETFKKSVEAKLSCDVELFDPFSGLQVAGELVENKPAYSGRFAPLLGMLADEAASAAHGIDFLHPREKPTPPSPWRKNGVYAALGVSVCVAIGLVLLFNRMSMDTRIADLNQESRGMQETVEKAQKKSDDLNRIEDFLSRDYAWLDELKQLSDTLPPADVVILTQLSMTSGPGGGQISLDGYTKESSQIQEVERALRQGGRQVLPKNKGIEAGRKEYKWQFKEVIVLPPRTDFQANVAVDPTVAAPESELPDDAVQETPDENPPVAPIEEPPKTETGDLEAATENATTDNLASIAAQKTTQDEPVTDSATGENSTTKNPSTSDPQASNSP
jgi:Tfp pilus assembly PilM family ATPase/Tfp pilus assembly protein PilN